MVLFAGVVCTRAFHCCSVDLHKLSKPYQISNDSLQKHSGCNERRFIVGFLRKRGAHFPYVLIEIGSNWTGTFSLGYVLLLHGFVQSTK